MRLQRPEGEHDRLNWCETQHEPVKRHAELRDELDVRVNKAPKHIAGCGETLRTIASIADHSSEHACQNHREVRESSSTRWHEEIGKRWNFQELPTNPTCASKQWHEQSHRRPSRRGHTTDRVVNLVTKDMAAGLPDKADFHPLPPLTGRSAQLRSAQTSREVPVDHGAPVENESARMRRLTVNFEKRCHATACYLFARRVLKTQHSGVQVPNC